MPRMRGRARVGRASLCFGIRFPPSLDAATPETAARNPRPGTGPLDSHAYRLIAARTGSASDVHSPRPLLRPQRGSSGLGLASPALPGRATRAPPTFGGGESKTSTSQTFADGPAGSPWTGGHRTALHQSTDPRAGGSVLSGRAKEATSKVSPRVVASRAHRSAHSPQDAPRGARTRARPGIVRGRLRWAGDLPGVPLRDETGD